ncbi:MAG: hypothetical protein ACPIOQ_64295, partial [Promethearchaeia archaeon]
HCARVRLRFPPVACASSSAGPAPSQHFLPASFLPLPAGVRALSSLVHLIQPFMQLDEDVLADSVAGLDGDCACRR